MPETASIKSLHLEYRLWIAELNYVINLIRIFNDRMLEIKADPQSAKSATPTKAFEKKLADCRENIDELRHRMQIEKMNLAHIALENQSLHERISIPENYTAIRNDFYNFRVFFNELKGELMNFETSTR